MAWTVDKLRLTNSETKRDIILGDVVEVTEVVYKTVSVYDDDADDPTIRSAESVAELCNYRIVIKHESLSVYKWLHGLVVGFRFLPECQIMQIKQDGYGEFSYTKTATSRKPYLLVCFWPTHKPLLVDPDYAFTSNTGLKFHVNWRKQLPPHPDKEFWKSVDNASEN